MTKDREEINERIPKDGSKNRGSQQVEEKNGSKYLTIVVEAIDAENVENAWHVSVAREGTSVIETETEQYRRLMTQDRCRYEWGIKNREIIRHVDMKVVYSVRTIE